MWRHSLLAPSLRAAFAGAALALAFVFIKPQFTAAGTCDATHVDSICDSYGCNSWPPLYQTNTPWGWAYVWCWDDMYGWYVLAVYPTGCCENA